MTAESKLSESKRGLTVTCLGWIALWLNTLFPVSSLAEQVLPKTLEESFTRGVEAQKAGQLKEAERAFMEVLRQGGKTAFLHNNLGIVYQQQSAHQRALSQFREAVRLQPDYAAPRFLMGASLMALGRMAEAIRELEQALKLDPGQTLGRLQLIRAYELAGSPVAVVDQYRKLREGHPQDPEYAYQLGKAYLKLSGWAFQRMKEHNPRSPLFYQALANNYRLQGRDELAVRALKQAIEIDPKLPELHLLLAEIYLAQGKSGEARKELDLELSVLPDSRAALGLKEKLEASSR